MCIACDVTSFSLLHDLLSDGIRVVAPAAVSASSAAPKSATSLLPFALNRVSADVLEFQDRHLYGSRVNRVPTAQMIVANRQKQATKAASVKSRGASNFKPSPFFVASKK